MDYGIVKYTRSVGSSFMVPGITNPVITYSGPGDVVAGGLNWWGLRAYSSRTVGSKAIRLRRDSDNAESDFSTRPSGDLDVTSIATFGIGASLFATTLYDQIGSIHLVQATTTSQPQLVLSGLGTRPVLRFTAAGQSSLATAGNVAQNQPMTVSWVAKRTGGAGVFHGVFLAGNGNWAGGFNPASGGIFMLASSEVDATGAEGSFHAVQSVLNGASSDLNIDGTANAGDAGTSAATGNVLEYSDKLFGNVLNGDSMELGWWPFAFSGGQSSSMSSNQHAYWGF